MSKESNYTIVEVTSPNGVTFTGTAGREEGFMHLIAITQGDSILAIAEEGKGFKTYDELPFEAKAVVDEEEFEQVKFELEKASGYADKRKAEVAKEVEALSDKIKRGEGIEATQKPIPGYVFADILQDNLYGLTKSFKTFDKTLRVVEKEAAGIFGQRGANGFIDCLFDEVEKQIPGRRLGEFSSNQFGKIMSKVLAKFIDILDEGELILTHDGMYVFAKGNKSIMSLRDEDGNELGIEIHPQADGTAIVADKRLGVKSEHPSVEAAQEFVESLFDVE